MHVPSSHPKYSDEADCLSDYDIPSCNVCRCECLYSGSASTEAYSYDQGVFGMNVTEINPEGTATLPHYIAVALPLTIFTAWVIVAFQSRYIFPDHAPFWHRLAWPFVILWRWMKGEQITFPTKKGVNGEEDGGAVPMQERGNETEDEDQRSDANSITIAIVGSPTSDGGFPAGRSHSFSFTNSGSSRAH